MAPYVSLWGPYGSHCPSMAPYGVPMGPTAPPWLPMGSLCLSMGSLWIPLSLHGSLCLSMGSLWVPLFLCVSLWVPYGSQYPSMAPYGVLMGPTAPPCLPVGSLWVPLPHPGSLRVAMGPAMGQTHLEVPQVPQADGAVVPPAEEVMPRPPPRPPPADDVDVAGVGVVHAQHGSAPGRGPHVPNAHRRIRGAGAEHLGAGPRLATPPSPSGATPLTPPAPPRAL